MPSVVYPALGCIPMMLTVVLLLASAVAIYVACEYFVNGIEWVGRRFGVSRTAVGTVLAAFGTALPESVVTLVAVAFGDNQMQRDIGVGAALGGPLVLATMAYAVVGFAYRFGRSSGTAMPVVEHEAYRLRRDQGWFVAIFVFKVGLGLIAFSWKPWLGILFLLAYAVYVWHELRRQPHEPEAPEAPEAPDAPEPLKLRPQCSIDERAATGWALLQTAAALLVIFGSSQLFVQQLEHVGPALGLSPQLVALLLSPIATELPEILNAVIWVRQGKTALALSNISGSMMIQATVPSAFGLFFTPWVLDRALLWAAAVTVMAIVAMLLLLRRRTLSAQRLVSLSSLYALFAAGLVVGLH